MYRVESTKSLLAAHRRLLSGGRGAVSRTVILLGVTSLLTDISAEMVAAVLPLYLFYTAGLSPLQFGLVGGVYQGAAAVVRIASGFAGDRWQRHKLVAAIGYALSAFSKLALVFASAWAVIGAIVLADRTGKGIRTAPRDAMISLATPRESLGVAFGVHRALDTTGALLGPLLAFALLALAPFEFDMIFIVSFLIALVGLAVLTLLVEQPPVREKVEGEPPVTLRAAGALLRVSRFRALVVAASGLAAATISDWFVYIGLQRRLELDVSLFPLLFVGTAVTYMVLAVPMGRLADRVGRERVFVAGYVLLALVYASLLIPGLPSAAVPLIVLLLGAYYAATDGVLAAAASAVLPAELRGSGLAILGTGSSLGALVASVAFGALWTTTSFSTAVVCFGSGLAVVLVAAAFTLARTVARA